MKAKVFFIDLRATPDRNMSTKLQLLLDKTGIKQAVKKDDIVALKMHFGEKGNTAFIRPIFIRDIVEKVIACGGKPFLTDANTLYRGERGDAVAHTLIALKHGFTLTTAGAPVVIADGLRGTDCERIRVSCKHFRDVSIASAVVRSDSLISIAHFKGHELSGFGGAIKNIGMGCASREGKMKQHTDIAPAVDRSLCIGCRRCADWCPAGAIGISRKKAAIRQSVCLGCAECITLCPRGAIQINWAADTAVFQEKMAEYAFGVLKNKKGRAMHINFLTSISPACDCYGHADRPVVPDIGITASCDPVALDQASADLVNSEEGFRHSALSAHHEPGGDKFKGLYPDVDWEIQLRYAQKLGLGTRSYALIKL